MMERRVDIPVVGLPDEHIEFLVHPVRLVRERVFYQVEIAGALEQRGDLLRLMDYVFDRAQAVQHDVTADNAIAVIGVHGVVALSAEIASGGAAPPDAVGAWSTKKAEGTGMRRMLEILYRADEFDEDADPVCECRACKGTADEDPLCRFAFERPALADVMAGWNWDLITECWDLPWYVYQARADQSRAAARGEAVPYQQARRDREAQKRVDEMKKALGIGGGHV